MEVIVSSPTEHNVYALKFAEHPGAPRGAFFFGPTTPSPDELIKLDYFFWLVRSPDRDIVVDIGFTAETADRRGRPHLRSPDQALLDLGVDPAGVELVIMTHLHYDHAGCWAPFTTASFVLQESELAFWTGPHLSRPQMKWLVELADLEAMVSLNYEGRLQLINGDAELVPGVSVHRVGGHTPGSQVVRVHTSKGGVVLASDAAPMYENQQTDTPFGILTDVPGSLDAFDRMYALAESPELIIPGHDPLVFERFDSVAGQEGLTARIA